MLLGEHAMDLPSVFDWFAQDSIRAAEQTDEPRKREILLKLASQWAAAAQRCRDEQLKLRPGTPVASNESRRAPPSAYLGHHEGVSDGNFR
jgi:Tfp pilus assembly major pilin PilA